MVDSYKEIPETLSMPWNPTYALAIAESSMFIKRCFVYMKALHSEMRSMEWRLAELDHTSTSVWTQ